ncbi:MAG: hypothetical protein GWO26_03720, partial [Phycisphaerae bacterium]|nr:hypothetical protein [Phycisphaerae bacterium]
VSGGTNFTRSSTEQIAFQVHNSGTFDRIYFDHFTDDTSPTFTEETITSAASSADDVFTSTLVEDDNVSAQDNYAAYVDNTSQDVFLQGDDGGTTWSDQNSSTAIRTGTVDGISANIFTR